MLRSRPRPSLIEACELFHTSAVEAEMFSGMSKTEKSTLQELLTLAVAQHGHSAEKLIAAHETDEQRRRHKPGQVVGRFTAANASEGGSRTDTYWREQRLKTDQTRATGLAVLGVQNLSSKEGRPESALFYLPAGKFNPDDKADDAAVCSFPFLVNFFFYFCLGQSQDKCVMFALSNITLLH